METPGSAGVTCWNHERLWIQLFNSGSSWTPASVSPRAPVLVHELTDESLGVRPAEDRHPVLLMAKRPEDQHVLEPLDPAAFLDRGAPLGDDAFDVRAPAVFEPLGRFLALRRLRTAWPRIRRWRSAPR